MLTSRRNLQPPCLVLKCTGWGNGPVTIFHATWLYNRSNPKQFCHEDKDTTFLRNGNIRLQMYTVWECKRPESEQPSQWKCQNLQKQTQQYCFKKNSYRTYAGWASYSSDYKDYHLEWVAMLSENYRYFRRTSCIHLLDLKLNQGSQRETFLAWVRAHLHCTPSRTEPNWTEPSRTEPIEFGRWEDLRYKQGTFIPRVEIKRTEPNQPQLSVLTDYLFFRQQKTDFIA